MTARAPTPRITTAARLLRALAKDSTELHDSTAAIAGISKERATAAADGTVRLTLDEQLRLADAAARYAQHRRFALRLCGLVLVVWFFVVGVVVCFVFSFV